jgi:mannan endo-1,4-beta-mannosidase
VITNKKRCGFLFLVIIFIAGCTAEYNSVVFQNELKVKLADSTASKKTVLLFYNLKKLSQKKIIFGHQDATAYGVGWKGERNRSDIKDIINKHPGLYGWDFSSLFWPPNIDVQKNPMTTLVKEAYSRGGVNIFCWHSGNPVTDQSFYDTTIAVPKILPGGGYYLKYLSWLDKIADYAKSLVDSIGQPIPIIFRPFHEFDGNWFWWGKPFCSQQEFINLWKTTVSYLRDKRGVQNILYAFSPDRRFHSQDEYLERYPGDDYVDILGTDIYGDFNPDGEGLEWIKKKLHIISKLAEEKNKIAAFTETGLEGVPNPVWWTDRLLNTIKDDSIKIAFVMIWRNANDSHHYAPYRGHLSVANFVDFSMNSKILFEDQLPDLYKLPIYERAFKKIDELKTEELIKFIATSLLRF